MEDIPELVTELPEDLSSVIKSAKQQQVSSSLSTEQSRSTPTSEKVVDRKIPITIITGYLGSGKSTLLENISRTSNKKLAIILNEFGDSSLIEKSVTIKDTEKNESIQEWLDLGNGCLCCTVKDNGVMAIEQLIEKSKDKIDYILLETTGIADPAPIARMFWLDEGLSSNVYIDGVITVVDSEHILKCLDDVGGHWHRENNHLKITQTTNKDDLTQEELADEMKKLDEGLTTAHLQIALADAILVNKIDKLNGSDKQIQLIVDRIKAINSSSPIHTTSFGDIHLNKILDLHAFEANVNKLTSSLNYITNSTYHDNRIATVTLGFPFFTEDRQFGQIESFLQYILWENEVNHKQVEIHRVKGILVKNSADPVIKVIQGVRDTYDIIEGGELIEGVKENKVVLIGKNLDFDDLRKELKNYLKYA